MSIYVWAGRINYPAMRWPCPYGYHVPTDWEWGSVVTAWVTLWAWTSSWGDSFRIKMKIPFAWFRTNWWWVTSQGSIWEYHSCKVNTTTTTQTFRITSTLINWGWGLERRLWLCVRPFKDDPVIPTSSWTTIYDWSSVASGAGIFWNSSSWLISISKDGTTWYTIADKNLWATTVYNDWDTLSEANCWKYFQFWNNYPFPRTGSVTTWSAVDASAYWPWNWYYSNIFRTSANPRDTSGNGNLRWWVVWAVKADVKDICVGAGVDDYSPMQWPCPDGFHIPWGTTELNERWLINVVWRNLGAWSSTNGTDFSKYLKLPLAWYLSGSAWSRYSSGSEWWYACNQVHPARRITSNSVGYTRHSNYDWFSVRPFKDVPVVPDSTWTTLHQGTGSAGIFWNKWLWLISLSSNGTKWYTIADKNLGAKVVWNYGDTLNADNCGFFYQSWNNYWFPYSWPATTSTSQVDVSNYWPSYPYFSSTFIKRSSSPYEWGVSSIYNPWKSISTFHDLRWSQTLFQKKWNVKHVYVGTTPARPTYNPWIYWNKSKGLISISSDWKKWITIADKNVGAKVVYNDGDTLSQDNCWYYYQWGNNYGFAWTGSLTTTTTRVNASTYWPTNPYYWSTFVKVSSSPYDWNSNQNDNLWGDTTNTLVARQWPCPTGFHVHSERLDVYKILVNDFWLPANGNTMKTYLKLPFAWYRPWSSASANSQWTTGRYWTSNAYQATTADYMDITSDHIYPNSGNSRSNSGSIRPFKNEPVVPDNSWAVLYKPS